MKTVFSRRIQPPAPHEKNVVYVVVGDVKGENKIYTHAHDTTPQKNNNSNSSNSGNSSTAYKGTKCTIQQHHNHINEVISNKF